MCIIDEKEMKRIAGTAESKELSNYVKIFVRELVGRGFSVENDLDYDDMFGYPRIVFVKKEIL